MAKAKAEEKPKPKKKYQGYFNYHKINCTDTGLKCYVFKGWTKKQIQSWIEKLMNPELYIYVGVMYAYMPSKGEDI